MRLAFCSMPLLQLVREALTLAYAGPHWQGRLTYSRDAAWEAGACLPAAEAAQASHAASNSAHPAPYCRGAIAAACRPHSRQQAIYGFDLHSHLGHNYCTEPAPKFRACSSVLVRCTT